jgi:hypothetical protein
MVLGSIAGAALFYELIQTAHQHQLAERLHSPTDVWIGAGVFFLLGWLLTFAVRRIVGWFALFVMIGSWAASGIAASSNQMAYAVPLLGVGLAAGALAVVAFETDSNLRRPRAA